MKNATTFNEKTYSSKSAAQRAASKFIRKNGTKQGVVSCPRVISPTNGVDRWGCVFL